MEKYLNQAEHNENFLEKLKEEFPYDFHDWKITVIFYTSLHYIKCFALTKSITLKHHKDTFDKLHSGELSFGSDDGLKKCYFKLYAYSKLSRYSGFLTIEAFDRICMINYTDSTLKLGLIKKFVKGELEKLKKRS